MKKSPQTSQKRDREPAVPHYLISISPYALYGIHSGCSPTRKVHAAATSAVLLVVLVYLDTYFGRKLFTGVAFGQGHACICACLFKRGYVARVTKACWGTIDSRIFPRSNLLIDFVWFLEGCF